MSNIHRKVALVAAFVGATLALGLAVTAPSAGAQTGQPVTDYAAYPQPLPAGCPDGANALLDVSFDNGRGGTATDLRALDLRSGDTLTMSWSAFAPGCRTVAGDPAIAVSMPAYDAGAGTFDPNLDQQLLPGWTTCGADQTACALNGGRYRLSVTIPAATVACNIQTEAVIGLPLAVVGPHGSYYNSVIHGDQRPNMLIAATSLATAPCPLPVTPPPPVAPPAVAPPPVAPLTTAPPTTAPPTQPAVAPVTVAPVSATTVTTSVPTGVEAAQVTRAAPLPATGSNDVGPVAFAAALLLLGAGALVAGRRAGRGRTATHSTR